MESKEDDDFKDFWLNMPKERMEEYQRLVSDSIVWKIEFIEAFSSKYIIPEKMLKKMLKETKELAEMVSNKNDGTRYL